MTDLLHRIETAEAGNRELSDEVLMNVRGGYEIFTVRPCPTTNLQAAVDLVPEGWCVSIEFEVPGTFASAEIWPIAGGERTFRTAATPALALCAAILRSKGVE